MKSATSMTDVINFHLAEDIPTYYSEWLDDWQNELSALDRYGMLDKSY